MKQMRTCAAIVITVVWAVAIVWGQSQPKATPKAAATSTTMGVEVKVTRIQETRYRDFGPDATGEMPGTQVSLGVTGDLAGKAHLFGKLKIEKAVDDKGTRLSREESPFTEDVTKGFISTQKSFGPKIENGFGFDIPLGSAKRGASNITQLKGSFLILSGTKSSVVIPDVASLAGKEAPNPELKAAHVTIKVESVEGNKVTYTMAGSVEAVLEVALVGADGQTIDTSNGSSSTDGGPTFYTMEASAMPANAGFKVALVTDATTTTIPFDLKNIPLP